MQELLLVRHAAATGQDASAALTAEGERQAQVLTDVLIRSGVQRVISSPFVRAMETVRPFCNRTGIQLETDDRLVERVLSGRDLPDWRDHLRQSFDDADYCLDGGESSRSAQARGLSALQAAQASGERCVLVTHGNLLALMLRSMDAAVGFDEWSKLSNPDAFLVQVDDEGLGRFSRVWS